MAGLSDFITNTANQSTTMPGWYDTAQQNIVSQAGTAANKMPTLQNTVAGQAINNLSNPNTNPFMQAQSTLSQIGSGAANPWIVSQNQGFPAQTSTMGSQGFPTGLDPTGLDLGNSPSWDLEGGVGPTASTINSGNIVGGGAYNVAPNLNTAMGGLFQAQNQQLNQLLPQYTAQPNANAIGAGQFGSLRNETAVDKAMADAQANLFAQQMQAALQNQQTGVQAAQGLGQVGTAGTTAELGLGQAQQSDPFTAAANYGKIVGGIQAPTNIANRTQLSPLNTIGSLASAGSAGYSALNSATGGALGNLFKNLFSSNSPTSTVPGAADNRDVGVDNTTDPNYVAPVSPVYDVI